MMNDGRSRTESMHASSLLKSVLKPRNIPSSSSGQSLTTKDSKARGNRAASPESTLATVSVNKKMTTSPRAPVKMSCLCAPTSHAGSFRCRLHRGTQQSWGGKPLAHSAPAGTSPKPPPAPVKVVTATPTVAASIPATAPVAVENRVAKRPISHSPPSSRHHPISAFSPPLRSPDSRPSRLSKVSVAADVEGPIADGASPPKPSPLSSIGNDSIRYSKFTHSGGRPNGAILDSGTTFAKKFNSEGKNSVLREVVIGSGGHGGGLSRAGLSL